MKARSLHPWRVSYREAVRIQERLRSELCFEPLVRPPETVAAVDVAYARRTHRMYAAAVVVRVADGALLEEVGVIACCRFPYIPGLFSFRELPPLVEALERLESRPDVLMVDGHGLAHPRRFGLACHAGLLFDLPCVGVAKKRLVGEVLPLGRERGEAAPILDRAGEVIGAALRTRTDVKPVFVSCGHRIELREAVELVLSVSGSVRLPEPARLAHAATKRLLAADVEERGGCRPSYTYPDFVKLDPQERVPGRP